MLLNKRNVYNNRITQTKSMSPEINLKVSEAFLKNVEEYAKKQGFSSVQDFLEEAAQEKMCDSLEVREEYLKSLESKEATTFLSVEESEKVMQNLKKQALEYERNKAK